MTVSNSSESFTARVGSVGVGLATAPAIFGCIVTVVFTDPTPRPEALVWIAGMLAGLSLLLLTVRLLVVRVTADAVGLTVRSVSRTTYIEWPAVRGATVEQGPLWTAFGNRAFHRAIRVRVHLQDASICPLALYRLAEEAGPDEFVRFVNHHLTAGAENG